MSLVGQTVKCEWRDAWQDGALDGFMSVEGFKDEFLITTVGFLVRDGDVVSIAPERAEDGYRATTHIPSVLVRSIRLLEEPGVTRAPAM